MKTELQADPGAANRRQHAARERAARERAKRLRKALEQLPLVEAQKKGTEKKAEARVSTTDPEARIITGVDVTNSGGDQGKMAPMIEQHPERYGQTPDEMLVDGGFTKKDDIPPVSAPQGSTTVYAPVPVSKDPDRDPHTPRPDDSPAVVE